MSTINRAKVIIVPYFFTEKTTDVYDQTLHNLAKSTVAVKYELSRAQLLFFWDFLMGKITAKKLISNLKSSITLTENHVVHFRPLRLLPFHRVDKVSHLNQALNLLLLFLYLRFTKNIDSGAKSILWLIHPYSLHYVEKVWGMFDFTLYDCTDFYQVRSRQSRYEKQLLQHANFVVVNSQFLLAHHSQVRSDIIKAPLGFRLESFQNRVPSTKSVNKKPVIGYVGGINSRVNYRLLHTLIQHNLGWEFVLHGPVYRLSKDQQAVLKKIKALPNVSIGMSKHKSEIPDVIARFDVAIIPYSPHQAFNFGSFPMKVLEYFYLGKPVVSSPIHELNHYPKFVKIADDLNDWQEHIAYFLSKKWPNAYKLAQRKIAEENSWERKISYVNHALNQKLRFFLPNS